VRPLAKCWFPLFSLIWALSSFPKELLPHHLHSWILPWAPVLVPVPFKPAAWHFWVAFESHKCVCARPCNLASKTRNILTPVTLLESDSLARCSSTLYAGVTCLFWGINIPHQRTLLRAL
jgi:hypothetical protein